MSDTYAYAVIAGGGADARVEVTPDGGRTNQTVASIPRPIARRGFEIAFVSPQVGYLTTANGGQLYRTTDGAHSWHEVTSRRP